MIGRSLLPVWHPQLVARLRQEQHHPEFALWNVPDLGYLTIYALDAIATGKIKASP